MSYFKRFVENLKLNEKIRTISHEFCSFDHFFQKWSKTTKFGSFLTFFHFVKFRTILSLGPTLYLILPVEPVDYKT